MTNLEMVTIAIDAGSVISSASIEEEALNVILRTFDSTTKLSANTFSAPAGIAELILTVVKLHLKLNAVIQEPAKNPFPYFEAGNIVEYVMGKAIVVENRGLEVLCPCPDTIVIQMLDGGIQYTVSADELTISNL